jgi:hypothetical protein
MTRHNLLQELKRDSSDENVSRLIEKSEQFPNLTHPEVLLIKDPKTLIPAKPWIPRTSNVRLLT